MSALEQEILEKFRLLDENARRRAFQQMRWEFPAEAAILPGSNNPTSPEEFLEWAREFRAHLRAKYGDREIPSSTEMLNELRNSTE